MYIQLANCEVSLTGVIVAVLGRELKGGSFEVEDYTFASLPPLYDAPVAMETDKDQDKYVYVCVKKVFV